MDTKLKPTTKVTAMGAAGAITTIIIYALSLYHIVLPGEVAAAITTLVGFAGGYLIKE